MSDILNKNNVQSVSIKLVSPQEIKEKSFGHIKKSDTINYRTFKPERGGLFCAKIFGPIRDYECICGKYKRIKYKGIVCDKCGVEVISSQVRRKRFGHIELASPVIHPWFGKGVPNYIKILLGLEESGLIDGILLFENYIILKPDHLEGVVISESVYREWKKKIKNLQAKTGSFGLKLFFEQIESNLTKFIKKKQENLLLVKEKKRKILLKQIKLLIFFRDNNIKISWLFITILPVLPPELRPLIQLETQKFASSDLNDLYRKIINRNNRLKKLIELDAPIIIIQNEKKMLEDSVIALLDNTKIGFQSTVGTQRQLKSLTEILKGKEGRLRQNLLGKRVDYSARTVIVVGPELRLNQCGLPKKIAFELFKPFIYHKLLFKKIALTLNDAKTFVEKEEQVVFFVLEEILKNYSVLLNRAPTLHRLGIQSFDPILIDGKSIQLHPLVCQAFNADFDGDQMAVHVPLSLNAQTESNLLLKSTQNILSPSNGLPIINPTKDMLLGLYFLTSKNNSFIQKSLFLDLTNDSIYSFVSTNDKILRDLYFEQYCVYCRYKKKTVKSTIGRLILYNEIKKKNLFQFLNTNLTKISTQKALIACFKFYGFKWTIKLAEIFMFFGFFYATIFGFSLCLSNLRIPYTKKIIVEKVYHYEKIFLNWEHYGISLYNTSYSKHLSYLWINAGSKISQDMLKSFKYLEFGYSKNSLFFMFKSGARGSLVQILQLSGLRGLILKPDSSIFPVPVLSNFKEGLSTFEYFISTHGARKGLADTALKTANSGYLTRKLVDVAHNVIITQQDCGTKNTLRLKTVVFFNKILTALKQANSRYISHIIGDEIYVRSPITCEAIRGMCAMCYGDDLSTHKQVKLGTAVGVIAAQSIGEPGTQLTMRTFHTGGVTSGEFKLDNLLSLNAGKVLFENIKLVNKTVISETGFLIIVDGSSYKELERHNIYYGFVLKVANNSFVKKNEILAQWDHDYVPIIAETSGFIYYKNLFKNVSYKTIENKYTGFRQFVIKTTNNIKKCALVLSLSPDEEKIYFLKRGSLLLVKDKQFVNSGDVLAKFHRNVLFLKDITQGLLRITDIFEIRESNKKDIKFFAEHYGFIFFQKKNKKITTNQVFFIISEDNLILSKYVLKSETILVQHGNYVKQGQQLTEGTVVNQKNLLRSFGLQTLVDYIINEIQKVFMLEHVTIHNKHIEVIIRQMIQYVIIFKTKTFKFLEGDLLLSTLAQMIKTKTNLIDFKQTILGITKSSLTVLSFLSASSFQETSKILTKAIIEGKKDFMLGLKENIIVGNLVPCGTAFSTNSYNTLINLEQQYYFNFFTNNQII